MLLDKARLYDIFTIKHSAWAQKSLHTEHDHTRSTGHCRVLVCYMGAGFSPSSKPELLANHDTALSLTPFLSSMKISSAQGPGEL